VDPWAWTIAGSAATKTSADNHFRVSQKRRAAGVGWVWFMGWLDLKTLN
jgi:hypothetical protein